MFFLGGLNSILPYVIYLSLIWICLIIGFTGKIDRMMHILSPEAALTGQLETQSYDSKVIQYFQFPAKEKISKEVFVHQENPFKRPICIICNRKPHFNPIFFFTSHLINALSFRGPPQSTS
jgi:hypothetical protein